MEILRWPPIILVSNVKVPAVRSARLTSGCCECSRKKMASGDPPGQPWCRYKSKSRSSSFQPSSRFLIILWSIHITQYTPGRVDVGAVAFGDELDDELLRGISDFAHSTVRCRINWLRALT